MNITYVVWVVLTLVVGTAAYYLRPQATTEELRKDAAMFVAEVEKRWPNKSNEEKLKYAIDQLVYLQKYGHFNDAVLRAAVEWGVTVIKDKGPQMLEGMVGVLTQT